MDFDATQAIALSDYDDDTDDETPEDEKKPVAQLKVQGQKGFPETSLDIYEGLNLIGRDATCNVHIPLKALSKQHACIEISGGTHMLYDKNSRNKTRKGKMYLTPDVRYNIQDNEELTFADVKCTYIIDNKNALDGDETDPGSEEITGDSRDGNKRKAAMEQETMYELDEDDTDGDDLPSSDLLLQTQAYAVDGTGPVQKRHLLTDATQLYAAESEEESEEIIAEKPFGSSALVKDTPAGKQRITSVAFTETQYIPESDDSEEESEGATSNQKSSNANKQTLKYEDMATMAYDMVVDSEEEDESGTTASKENDTSSTKLSSNEQEVATQAYTMAPEDEEMAHKLLTKKRSPRSKRSPRPVPEEATMAYDMDVESTQTAEEIITARKKATQPAVPEEDDETDDENMATQTFGTMRSVDGDDMATQTFGTKEDVKEDVKEMVAADIDIGGGTMEYEYESDDDVSLIPSRPSVTTASADDETEEEAATQAFGMDADAPTLAVEQIKPTACHTTEDEATQVFSESTCPEVGNKSGDTSMDDKETQVFGEDKSDVFTDVATMAVVDPPTTRKSALKTPKLDLSSDDENMSTLMLETSANLSTQVIAEPTADATMILPGSPSPRSKRKRVAFKDQTPDDEAATQVIPDANVDETMIIEAQSPKRKPRGRPPKSKAAKTIDTAVTESAADARSESKSRKSPENLTDDSSDATQVFGDDVDLNIADQSKTSVQSEAAPDCADMEDETQSFTTKPTDQKLPAKSSLGLDDTAAFSPGMSSTQIDTDAVSGAVTSPMYTPEKPAQSRASLTAQSDASPDLPMKEAYGDTFKKPVRPTEAKKRGRPSKSSAVTPGTSSTKAEQCVLSTDVASRDIDDDRDNMCTQAYTDDGDDLECTQAYSEKPAVMPPEPTAHSKNTRGKGKGKGKNSSKAPEQPALTVQPTRASGRRAAKHYTVTAKDSADVVSQESTTHTDQQRLSRREEPKAKQTPVEPDDIATQAYEHDELEDKSPQHSTVGDGFQMNTETAVVPSEPTSHTNTSTRGKGKGRGKISKIPEETSPTVQPTRASGRKAAKKNSTPAKNTADTIDPDELATQPFEEDSGETSPVIPLLPGKASRHPANKGRGTRAASVEPDDVATQAYGGEDREPLTLEMINSSVVEDETVNFLTLRGLQPGPIPEAPATRTKRGRISLPDAPLKPAAKPARKRGRASCASTLSTKSIPERHSKCIKTSATGLAEQTVGKSSRSGRGTSSLLPTEESDKSELSLAESRLQTTPEIPGPQKQKQKPEKCSKAKNQSEKQIATEHEESGVEGQDHLQDSTRQSGRKQRGRASVVPPTASLEQPAVEIKNGKRKAEAELEEPGNTRSGRQARGGKVQRIDVEDPVVSEPAVRKRGRGKTRAVEATETTDNEPASFPSGTSVQAKTPEAESEAPRARSRRTTGAQNKTNTPSHKETHEDGNTLQKTENTSGKTAKRASTQRKSKQTASSDVSVNESPESSVSSVTRRATRRTLDQSDTESIASEASSHSSRRSKRGTTKAAARAASTDSEASAGQGRSGKGKRASVDPPNKGGKGRKSAQEPKDMAPPTTPARTKKVAQGTDSPGTPTLRRRTMELKPKVMFTGLVDEQGQKIVRSLGGELTESVYDCTHLVTDKVRRTVKFLCILSRGQPIISSTWLDKCHQSKAFIDCTPFMVIDRQNEKKYQFRLATTLNKAAEESLLEGYKVHVTKSVLPVAAQMKDIIQCCGGTYLEKMPTRFAANTVVVSCEADKRLYKPAKSAGIPIVSSEFILSGTLQQICDVAKYQID